MASMDNQTIATVCLGLAVCAGWFGLGAWLGSRLCKYAGADKARVDTGVELVVRRRDGRVEYHTVPASSNVGEVHL